MKLYLQILIIGILLFSSNCQTCTVGGGTGAADGYYNGPTGAASRACVATTGPCLTGFSDVQGEAAGTLTADCNFCVAAAEFLNRIATVSGVTCATSCTTGYTDSSTGGAASSTLAANCGYCLTSTHTLYNGQCQTTCTTTGQYFTQNDGTCGTSCVSGYTDSSTGGAASSTLAANCDQCLTGLTNTAGVCACATGYLTSSISGTCGTACTAGYTYNSNGDAPAATSTGHCLYCASTHTWYRGQCYTSCTTGQFYTQNDGTCGTSCVTGYTDSSTGGAATSTLAANCQYCLSDYTENNQQCEKSSSQILKVSLFILLLIALIF